MEGTGAELFAQELFPKLRNKKYPNLPKTLTFLHAEDILELDPNLPRKQRETEILQQFPSVFIIGIGWKLKAVIPTKCAPRITTIG